MWYPKPTEAAIAQREQTSAATGDWIRGESEPSAVDLVGRGSSRPPVQATTSVASIAYNVWRDCQVAEHSPTTENGIQCSPLSIASTVAI